MNDIVENHIQCPQGKIYFYNTLKKCLELMEHSLDCESCRKEYEKIIDAEEQEMALRKQIQIDCDKDIRFENLATSLQMTQEQEMWWNK